jgi:MoaD family protein
MKEISVLYFGPLRQITGKRKEKIGIEESSTLLDLVHVLAQRNGKTFEEFVFGTNGRIRKGIAFAVNGDSILQSELRTRRINAVDEFVILPPISGG